MKKTMKKSLVFMMLGGLSAQTSHGADNQEKLREVEMLDQKLQADMGRLMEQLGHITEIYLGDSEENSIVETIQENLKSLNEGFKGKIEEFNKETEYLPESEEATIAMREKLKENAPIGVYNQIEGELFMALQAIMNFHYNTTLALDNLKELKKTNDNKKVAEFVTSTLQTFSTPYNK